MSLRIKDLIVFHVSSLLLFQHHEYIHSLFFFPSVLCVCVCIHTFFFLVFDTYVGIWLTHTSGLMERLTSFFEISQELVDSKELNKHISVHFELVFVDFSTLLRNHHISTQIVRSVCGRLSQEVPENYLDSFFPPLSKNNCYVLHINKDNIVFLQTDLSLERHLQFFSFN